MATRNYRIVRYIAVALALVALIVLVRTLRVTAPELHIPNFSPVSAVAIFSAYYFKKYRWLTIAPLIGMIIADFFLPGYAWHQRIIIYTSFALSYLIGYIVRKKYTLTRTLVASLAASLVFFLITNCVFLYHGEGPVMYPHTIAGQIASYTNALPFLRATLLGDLTFSLLIFGSYQTISSFVPARLIKRKVSTK